MKNSLVKPKKHSCAVLHLFFETAQTRHDKKIDAVPKQNQKVRFERTFVLISDRVFTAVRIAGGTQFSITVQDESTESICSKELSLQEIP